MIHWDTDRDELLYRGEVIPRRPGLVYRGAEAERIGLTAIDDGLDELVDPKDYKEVIAHCHEHKIFPMYHQRATWGPEGFQFNQNGLGYCWTWSGTGDLMNLRATEDKETVLLAPVSMGYLVGWRNEGNYLESFIRGACEDGIVPASHVPGGVNSTNRNPYQYLDGYEEERAKYRLDVVWDTDNRAGDAKRLQYLISILNAGRSSYAAWNHLGHAMSVVGIEWDESKYFNVVLDIRNSHNEDDLIQMSGSRCIPNEHYGFISSVLA